MIVAFLPNNNGFQPFVHQLWFRLPFLNHNYALLSTKVNSFSQFLNVIISSRFDRAYAIDDGDAYIKPQIDYGFQYLDDPRKPHSTLNEELMKSLGN